MKLSEELVENKTKGNLINFSSNPASKDPVEQNHFLGQFCTHK